MNSWAIAKRLARCSESERNMNKGLEASIFSMNVLWLPYRQAQASLLEIETPHGEE